MGQANDDAEGHNALPWKGLLCSIFFRFGFNIALDGKKVWPLSDFDEVPFLSIFPLDEKKVWPFATIWFTGQCWRINVPFLSNLFLLLSNFLWWFLGQVNGGAKGDDVLPCKGLLCSVFFFALVFILLWTGKRCDLCLIPMRFHFYLFSPWTEKGVTFRNNMIHRAVLKNKGSIFIYFIRFFSIFLFYVFLFKLK